MGISTGGGGYRIVSGGFTPQSREELRILVALYEIIAFDLGLQAELVINYIQVINGPRIYLNKDNLVVNSLDEEYKLIPLSDPECIKKAIAYVARGMHRENEFAAVNNSS